MASSSSPRVFGVSGWNRTALLAAAPVLVLVPVVLEPPSAGCCPPELSDVTDTVSEDIE